MTNAELAKLFFPGCRKLVLIQGLTLLKTAAGEQRIKLELSMPLDDGKQIGMPSYIGDSYDHLARLESIETSVKLDLELEGETITIHATEESQKVAQIWPSVTMKTFSMIREEQGDEEELSGVHLKFLAYVPANGAIWSWLYGMYRMGVYMIFESTQKELDLAPAAKQMALTDEAKFDKQRKSATSKDKDAEFIPPKPGSRAAAQPTAH